MMLTIDELENFLWEYFGKSWGVRTDSGAYFSIQDISPSLADFLHERGVSIDWSDGSRYGTAVTTREV